MIPTKADGLFFSEKEDQDSCVGFLMFKHHVNFENTSILVLLLRSEEDLDILVVTVKPTKRTRSSSDQKRRTRMLV